MTNADKIRSMTNEELKQFLANIRENNQAFDVEGYCKDNCPLAEECMKGHECIDSDPHSDIEWWLNQEAE